MQYFLSTDRWGYCNLSILVYWILFPYLPVVHDDAKPFNLGAIKPTEVKKILQAKNATSAPGPDGILYGIMRKLPATHHFMSTLFSKLLVTGDPPESWSNSRISLIHKANDTDIPSNFRMISLTCAVGKVYHQIMANRTATFLIDNNVIDPAMQKAFLQGINGCIEHTQVMQEILAHARNSNKTCHITYFDLADAFGSVEHDLIYYTMERNGLPPVVIAYVRNLYSRLSGYIQGNKWTSEPFKFRKGVFQGDPWSPIIFLQTFNPILEDLKSMEQDYGYNMNGTRFISLPFADDFCLITSHMRHHQRIINQIVERVKSMNLVLKPVKCRSISICSGSAKEVSFFIGDYKVPTVKDKPEKFLGSYITFLGKTSETYDIIKSKLSDLLENVDSVNIRGEYKTRIYSQYGLPSLRYILSVHSLTDTQLKELDNIQTRTLNQWLKIPKHGANRSGLYCDKGLGLKLVSEMYFECRTMCLASSLVRADPKVKAALDSKIQRESSWSRKMQKFGYAKSQSLVKQAVGNIALTKENWPDIKKKVKKSIKDVTKAKWAENIEPLVKQGNLFKIAELCDGDLTWKSYMYNLPKGLLSFATRAAINVLPSGDNLKIWGRSDKGNCELCGNGSTLLHILNGCTTSLQQGRYTFRHNAVVSYLVKFLRENVDKDTKVYADIQGCTVNGGSIPAQVVPTAEKPDIVCVNNITKTISILELSVPFETNLSKARDYKVNKYASLVTDIENAGYRCDLVCFEVGSRGLISSNNKGQFKKIAKIAKVKQAKQLWVQSSKIAISCSYVIFNARYEKEWYETSNTF